MKTEVEVLAEIQSKRSETTPAWEQDFAGDDDHPLIASKGAGSVHVLRRRGKSGWLYLGYATWCCRAQRWVCGNWNRAATLEEALATLRAMPWEGCQGR